MSSDQSWKEKYFQELEAAEHRAEHWKAERNTLERMLVRTCLASEGQAPELDRLLARVRLDLRKSKVDIDSWKELQEQIDRQVALLDDVPASHGGGSELSATVASSPKPSAMTEDESDSDPSCSVANAEHQSQRLRIARRVGHLLGQLLIQVSLEPDAETKARNLQRALLTSENWDELRDGLNQVADLIVAAVTRSQREFESFLKRLDERLEMLQEHFSVQSSAQSGRQAAAEALDCNIREEIELVSRHIEASDDLQGLKTSVSRHLEFIGQAVDRFRVEETEREKMLSEQLQAVQEKVAVMEAHSERMQGQVRQERERALTDLLTQLPNREAWQERLSFEFNRWRRYQYPLTVGVMDIDLFKRVNDSFGHKAGDRVLQLVAREIKNRLRNTDFAARFGGEEFVLLFPETRADDALMVMEKLRDHISALPFHFGGSPVTITFSAGLTAFKPDDTEETVFDRADRALYTAKDAGRNCVRVG
ncbi:MULTISPECIES: GGDEF domain-containing protein [unclassified Marinobacter]|uniref:GGDEF domain-containing protein n=1 Tax=unclassified Marinobacter TaxID=83889 RepID=UPI0026E2CE86|nr:MULTISPECIES: GGDEF domain-containing protein [unclassified Marinobacter]MDO6443530.1 GGDEF domain-containing protein [Marinobacter sp. 2_MG-2023]MDO6824084.1 GGDEF domain-containing protein [Marinobacter sp. 1_MG-2023]